MDQSTTPNPPSPFSAGWSGAAMAVHAVQQIPTPILISLEVSGHGTFAIDPRSNTYVWSAPTGASVFPFEQFPTFPQSVRVTTYPVELDSPGLVGTAFGVDALFWMIGLNAFAGAPASWLRPSDKYRLKWWPAFDLLPHTVDQARAVKTLAKSMMSVEKLAKLARVPVPAAHDVVNALSLMGALRRLEASNSAPLLPPVPPELEPPTRERGRHVRRGG
ncbi:hypothetical protein BH10ACT7_BH10ACT7_14260 [soil metagenome]